MTTRLLFIVVFVAGVSSGWFGKTWLDSAGLDATSHDFAFTHNKSDNSSEQKRDEKGDVNHDEITRSVDNSIAATSNQSSLNKAGAGADGTVSVTRGNSEFFPRDAQQRVDEVPNGTAVLSHFLKLLDERRYYDAMVVYQELIPQGEQTATQLKNTLLDYLRNLSEKRNNNDFSDLIENYLSVYYDDIDVLLLLADFNQANGSYLEVVDVYLLAKTYAYTDVDQQNLHARLNGFIKTVDGLYTSQKNWSSLINLYAHINASGLMTSPYQYRQALAHLRNGDELSAIEQFRQLVNDSLVGESASIALGNLTQGSVTTATISTSVWEGSETIPLQQAGNQYLVDLTVNRQSNVRLLIDTGASMTTLTRSSFESLNIGNDAVKLDRRVFRTANGLIQGTVYSVPELSIGPFLMNDTQIAVLEFDMNEGVDGLLGMYVLGQFRFQIDQENIQLLLSRE